MSDSELHELRERVDCRTVLERAGWTMDAQESTRRAAKYRNGPAQIVIVTQEGRGWFDPLGDGRGDVLALAQHVWGGNLGQTRKTLRPLAGIPPVLLPAPRARREALPFDAVTAWRQAAQLASGSQAWRYLTGARGIPADIIEQASREGTLREGIGGTAWALHTGEDGQPCGWEMRGPRYKGFSKGGTKRLFGIGDAAGARRLAVAESAIDAMSLAAIEGRGEGTAYLSTGGGFGPMVEHALRRLLCPSVRLVAATDRGQGGEILADRLHRIAKEAGAGFGRLRPSAKDWNAHLAER